jgi:CO/xanthine dehydrogenase FAD-binding subunit
VPALSGITRNGDNWRMGATTRWTEIVQADYLPPLFDGLKAAAREVGGRQIQNSGTIAGNICNASPAADGIPPLISLKAHVEITGADGISQMLLEDFILGNRQTRLKPGELVTAVIIPASDDLPARGSFLKLGSRRYLVISLVMVAGTVRWEENYVIQDCRIVVGACSAVAQRLKDLEESLLGMSLAEDLSGCVTDRHFSDLTPIDDVRATASYRQAAAGILVRRMIGEWRMMHG